MPGQALIDHGRLLEVLGIEGELLGDLAHEVQLDAPVPTCPGWTSGELLRHVGSVYRAARGWLVGRRRPREWQRDPLPGQSLAEYLRTGHAGLVAELSRHDPAERAESWWPADRTYGFWCRRMAHESVLHRVDLQQAVGPAVGAVPADVAFDGIDEALALWFGQRLPMLGLAGTRAGSVGISAGGQHWIVRAGPGETIAWRCSPPDAENAAAVITGELDRMYLWLWGRAAPGAVAVAGDEDAAGQLWALLRLATR